MSNKKFTILKISFNYLVLALIFKFIDYLLGISFNTLASFLIVSIIIAYFVIKYLVYVEIEKGNITRKDILIYFMIYATIINFLLGLHIFYTIFLIIFLFLFKDKKTNKEDIIKKNIEEYRNKETKWKRNIYC